MAAPVGGLVVPLRHAVMPFASNLQGVVSVHTCFLCGSRAHDPALVSGSALVVLIVAEASITRTIVLIIADCPC